MSSKTISQKSVQTLPPRQWIGLIAVYLFIPLVLLVCGGDFGWWQAWLYSLLIFAAGIGGRIWAERRHPGLLAERQSIEIIKSAKAWDKVLAPLMALSLAFPMVIVAGLDHRYGWSPRISAMAHRDWLHLDHARVCFRCVGIGREPLFLQRGAHSDGSRACGV